MNVEILEKKVGKFAWSHNLAEYYCEQPLGEAIAAALKDLEHEKDHMFGLPVPQRIKGESREEYWERRSKFDSTYRCKMYASDVLHQIAMNHPQFLTDDAIDLMMKVFPDGNDTTKFRVIQIFGLLKREDTVDFLKAVLQEPLRKSTDRVVEKNGKYFGTPVPKATAWDPIGEAAAEALQIITGTLEIAVNPPLTSTRHIYRSVAPDQI